MSDSEDDEFKTKKKKTSGVRGRRGFSKKKSADGENGHVISESSTVYTSRVTKCFNDLVSNRINDEIRHALIDNINADVEEEDVLCPQKTEKNDRKPDRAKKNKKEVVVHEEILVCSDDEQNFPVNIEESCESNLNTSDSAVKSRSPTPPPSHGRQSKRHNRRMKRNVKKAVATLTQSLSAAKSQLDETKTDKSPLKDVCVIDDDDNEVFTVRVDILGKICRFLLLAEQPFSNIVAKIAEKERVEVRNVMLVHNDRTIRPSESPKSIGFNTVDIIKCHIRSSCNDSFNDSLGLDSEEANLIEILVQSRDSRQKEIVKAHPDKPLLLLMQEYSNRVKKDLSIMTFWFDGEMVTGNCTPSDLEMEDGDMLDMQSL